MEEQTWNYSGEFLKRAKIIISDKQILLENRELSFMRFPCRYGAHRRYIDRIRHVCR